MFYDRFIHNALKFTQHDGIKLLMNHFQPGVPIFRACRQKARIRPHSELINGLRLATKYALLGLKWFLMIPQIHVLAFLSIYSKWLDLFLFVAHSRNSPSNRTCVFSYGRPFGELLGVLLCPVTHVHQCLLLALYSHTPFCT